MNRVGRTTDYVDLARSSVETEREAVSLRDILAGLRRHWLLLAFCILIGMLVGAGAYFSAPTTFTGSSTVVLLARPEQLLPADQSGPPQPIDSAIVQSEIAIVRSAAIAGLVVDRFKLADHAYWNGSFQPSRWFGLQPSQQTSVEGLSSDKKHELAVRRVMAAVNAGRVESSYAIDVRVTAPTPLEASKLTNGLVEAYLDWHKTADSDRSRSTEEWLDSRLLKLREEVEAKESLVEQYRISEDLLSSEGSTMAEQQLVSAQAALADAQDRLADRTARLKQVQELSTTGGSVETSAAALESDVIRTLRVQDAEIARREAQLRATYFDAHPEIRKIEAEREDLRDAIRMELARIRANLSNEVEVARNRVRSSEAALGAAQSRVGNNREGTVRLNELERDAAASRKAYEDYLSRFQQTADRDLLPTVVARQVSPAIEPMKSDRPSLPLVLAMGGVIGTIAGFAIVLLKELLDDRLLGASDTLRKLGRRALVSIPHLRTGSMRGLAPKDRHPAGYLVARPMSAYAETYRVLRRAVTQGDSLRSTVVVAITSAVPDEGKTTVALSLARAAALGGQRVALVDCDLRRRSLATLMRLKPASGLSQAISDPAAVKDLTMKDIQTEVVLIPAVAEDLLAGDVLGSLGMQGLIDSLRKSFDFIVLDCPPVLALADAITASVLADTTVVVARADKTPARAIRAAINQIESAGGFVVGLALNCVQPNVVGRYSFDDSLYLRHAKHRYYLS